MESEVVVIPKQKDVRICEKTLLSVDEAAAYTGIGTKKLVALSKEPGCKFIIYVGAKRMFKRELLEEFLNNSSSV